MRGKNIENDELSKDGAAYISNDQRRKERRNELKQSNKKFAELSPEELDSIGAGVDILLDGDLANLDALDEEELLASLNDGSEAAIADNGDAHLIEDDYTKQARSLTVGSWLEFKGNDNNNYRAKISWMSEDASTYIFVTQTGQIAEKTLQGLSDSLRHKRASILDESPVFERAMDALLEDLQEHVLTLL